METVGMEEMFVLNVMTPLMTGAGGVFRLTCSGSDSPGRSVALPPVPFANEKRAGEERVNPLSCNAWFPVFTTCNWYTWLTDDETYPKSAWDSVRSRLY